MPKYIVETVARASIREYWVVEAADAAEAKDDFSVKGECVYDEVLGDEENREVDTVHPYADLASFMADERARKLGPKLLKTLQDAIASCDANCGDSLANALQSAKALVAQVTGAAEGSAA